MTDRIIYFTEQQLQRKFKHAKAFGITEEFNRVHLTKWRRILELHVQNERVELIEGTYRGQPVIHYVEWETFLNVMTDRDANFLSAWRLSVPQSDNMRLRGKI